MKQKIMLGSELVDYELIFSNRKSIGLEVHGTGEVVVRVPFHTNLIYIEEILTKKAGWILEKRADSIQTHKEKRTSLSSGDLLKYRGEEYQLLLCYGQVSDQSNKVALTGNILAVRVKTDGQEELLKTLESWYKGEAKRILNERSVFYAKRMGVNYQRIRINGPKKRWGSCSSKGNINYNWKIIMASDLVIDYLVVHELAHLKEMNHSKAFYQVVETVYPQYKKAMAWLKENGKFLELL